MYDEPLALLSEMQDKGLKLNVICYSAAIDACARGGQWKKGLQLLEDMRLRGVAPNQVRICSILLYCTPLVPYMHRMWYMMCAHVLQQGPAISKRVCFVTPPSSHSAHALHMLL
jgi:pentatricopeptide repeat protein